ncbi:FAD-binding oxidoreductase [Legionella spiritensis]|uniref:Cytokinin oxidase n=1 Tax=Legionella spiritensis TaxID=452 RepID=A0A0W0Z3H8_LEGSP|nr:FAD-binding oxidoreductase [Legionella spiritensis]KTD63363.1 cytokinin oxidase [Legionella spiritensis]SNV35330.1 cytokinin oxidase [Legionella spiritensis]
MPQTNQWSTSQIKQCEQQIGQAMLSDEHSLFSYGQDFGKLVSEKPHAVCVPETVNTLQKLLRFANQQVLPVAVRGNGLSQCGQSLPVAGGLTIHLERFNRILQKDKDCIWVEANASWADLLAVSLQTLQAPYVVPYNCNLSVGGVLSAGGVGASSFKYGSVVSHIKALEVITADGEKQEVDETSELFRACLAGQGRFGVISKACVGLRPCKKMVRTYFLVYLDKEQWYCDLQKLKKHADGIEAFCTPAIQGAKQTDKGRIPFAQWLYALHLSIEYDERPPELNDLDEPLRPWKILHKQDETIDSYFHRHDPRFAAMKLIGQWELQHPWYECFIPANVLFNDLEDILQTLPVHYANVVQVVPLADFHEGRDGFLMVPAASEIFAVMILNPGVHPALLPACLAVMKTLDSRFLSAGGKRYLSGFLGEEISDEYWRNHYGSSYQKLKKLKEKYDPNQIFRSHLHPF